MFKVKDAAARLKKIIAAKGVGTDLISTVFDFAKTEQTASFWYEALGRQASGEGFTATQLTYLTRLQTVAEAEERKTLNPINKSNIRDAAKYLTGTGTMPLASIFVFADTPQGESYWGHSAKSKTATDLNDVARRYIENWVLDAATQVL